MGVQMAKRQKYSDEFKREAVRLVESRGSKSVEAVADDLGIATSQLYMWRSKFGSSGDGKGSNEAQAEELRAENLRLKRELERVSKERELLKKSIAFFVKENG
jgi:transposase